MSGDRMRSEMLEQPAVLRRLTDRFDQHVAAVRTVVRRPLAGVVYVARGSSDNAAVYGRYLAELSSGRPAGLAAPSLHTLYDTRGTMRASWWWPSANRARRRRSSRCAGGCGTREHGPWPS